MKKTILLLALFAGVIFGLTLNAADEPSKETKQATVQTKTEEKAEDSEPGVALCLARGLCNIATGVLEVPRCMIYDGTCIPILGLIVGIPEGAALCVAREVCGVVDLLTFGTSGGTFHGKVFPNTVFTATWIPSKK